MLMLFGFDTPPRGRYNGFGHDTAPVVRINLKRQGRCSRSDAAVVVTGSGLSDLRLRLLGWVVGLPVDVDVDQDRVLGHVGSFRFLIVLLSSFEGVLSTP